MPINRAAWQDRPATKLDIRGAPYPATLEPFQLVVKVHAWAINPCDYFIQGSDALPFIKYPVILGEDVSGTVHSAGSSASAQFKTDDRVLAAGLGSSFAKNEMGGFQEFVVADARLTSHIPDSMSFAEGSVFPLTTMTSSFALFGKDFLALPYPKLEQLSTGKSLLVWGGSSSVGSNAIQLAKAAGFNVITTSSPKNFDYVKKLGASKAFDYSSETVVEEVVAELARTECAGIFMAAGSVEMCLQIAHKAKGSIFVATSIPVSQDRIPAGVTAKMVYEEMLSNPTEVREIFEKFLPDALRVGKYKVAPEPLIIKTLGLEGIQEGLDLLKKGVSAKKVVVLAG